MVIINLKRIYIHFEVRHLSLAEELFASDWLCTPLSFSNICLRSGHSLIMPSFSHWLMHFRVFVNMCGSVCTLHVILVTVWIDCDFRQVDLVAIHYMVVKICDFVVDVTLYSSMCLQGRQCTIFSDSPWFALFAGGKLRDVCYWAHDYSK